MLELRDIRKTYRTGEITVDALAGVSASFRKNEFVAILGQSGSGKTTMLNVIGGLDRYDSGDLVINGRSTKEYKDKDWDFYRNHSIGFVFQSYNLIPHQSVLSNVELALTLSGVSKVERRKRAKEVLTKVGLGDQMKKKPNQMSGGQMQRVAIARALINNPDILLADEPTGALDSETSLQIMDLISEIAKDRLVIMVTHNPELATRYANRIISLRDGVIIDDTNPYTVTQEELAQESPAPKKKKKKKGERTSMNGRTALSLSFNNLFTKKGRTMLTSFAGSIGIIGIALILSLSSGMRAYIASIEKDALSSFPITIESQAVDMSGMLEAFAGTAEITEADHPLDKIYTNNIISDVMKMTSAQLANNDLKRFKHYIESKPSFTELTSAIQYGYDLKPQIYKADTTDGVYKVFPNEMLETFTGGEAASTFSMVNTDLWQEMLGNKDLLNSQYEVIAGEWPDSYDEVVLVVDGRNEITDAVLYCLGILDPNELSGIIQAAMKGEEVKILEGQKGDEGSYTYDEFLNLKFKLVLNTDYYQKNEQGVWEDMSGDEKYMKNLLDNSVNLKISAIVKPAEGATATAAMGAVAYTSDLTEYVINHVNESEAVAAQKASPETDIFTGLPFEPDEEPEATAAPEETTTAAPATTVAAAPAAAFEKPSVGSIGLANGAPKAQMLAESFTMPNADNAMTEDEVYDYINKNLSGAEKEKMTETVKLILKDIRSGAERSKLIGYLDEMLAGQNIEGVGRVSGSQAYTYLQLMDKDSKLAMITAIITSAKSGNLPIGNDTPVQEETTVPEEPEEEKIKYSSSTYEENLSTLGVVSLDNPNKINMYPKDFEAKTEIQLLISDYNTAQTDAGHEEYAISYTDLIGTILSSVTKIINIVTYALIAFVAISLVVSSIMIGVITYISVLERTKEIGVLRSIGASKHDISRVFNSETFIVGLVSGCMGIGITLLLNIPINMIIKHFTGIGTIAVLPFYGGIALVIISVILTVIAGLVPSKLAANKDPVEALRTE